MTEKISKAEIERIKRQFVLRNLRFSPVEASNLLGISVRCFYNLVDEGLIKACPLRPGQQKGMKCTAAAIDDYRKTVMGDEYEPLEV